MLDITVIVARFFCVRISAELVKKKDLLLGECVESQVAVGSSNNKNLC